MVIDHIGIVVPSLEDGIRQWADLFGYQQKTDVVLNTRQKVRVVFLGKENSLTVKLIEPSDPTSPISRFAGKGGGLHHLCFKCEGITAAISALKSSGAAVVASPQPGEAFNNHEIAFLLARNNLNFELIDTAEKSGWK